MTINKIANTSIRLTTRTRVKSFIHPPPRIVFTPGELGGRTRSALAQKPRNRLANASLTPHRLFAADILQAAPAPQLDPFDNRGPSDILENREYLSFVTFVIPY